MLSTCANSNCRESFRYLRDGKLFRRQAETRGSSSEISNPEYFWLCARCCGDMSLRLTEDGQVIVVRAETSHAPRAADSDFIALDRRRGLLLSCLQILKPKILRDISVPRRRAAYAS